MIKVLIEVTAGKRDRHLYDEKTLAHKSTRRVSHPYPYPYGFIIETINADGGGVDCYVITDDRLEPGTIVDCEPIGLLEQDEHGEPDHKVLAIIPGQEITLDQELLGTLRDFIYGIFARFPEMVIRVGPLLPKQAALDYIEENRP
jgi:inorganic pyrophosphatase